MAPQRPFDGVEFAENPEPRCPCVLLLDTSASMAGQPIQELNDGLSAYFDELLADPVAAKRVEVAVVTFGGSVEVPLDFALVEGVARPNLVAQGVTPMGRGIQTALSMLEERKRLYRQNGISYYRPWVFMITDGAPTDPWTAAADDVRDGASRDRFSFFSVGVEGANFGILRQISPTDPLKLKGLRFRDLFTWLSASQKSVSRSTPGTSVQLVNPAAPGGWGVIPS